MGLNEKIREVRRRLGERQGGPPTAEELQKLNAFCADAADALETAQAAFLAYGMQLGRHLDFEAPKPGQLDVKRCVAALGVARGELLKALEDALRTRGVLQ